MTETWKCSTCEADGAWKRWNGDRLEIHCDDHVHLDSEPLDPEWPSILHDKEFIPDTDSWAYTVSVGIFIGMLTWLVLSTTR